MADDPLLVKFDTSGVSLHDTGKRTGSLPVVYNTQQEKELATFDQETRLMRAMNEIRDYTPSKMTTAQREMFSAMCENIFAKHGITPQLYREQFGHLGTPQNLRR